MALFLAVILVHLGIGVGHLASPHSGLSALLGVAPAQAAQGSSAQGEQSDSGDPRNCTDLNTASAKDLERAKGIGSVKAKAIVDDRAANGPYAKLEDLERVKGIGPATLENIRQAGFCVK